MSLFISLAFLLMQYTDTVHGKVICITPSFNLAQCHQDCCLTLSQFAEKYKSNGSDTDISLIFMPGNHSLNEELHLSAANNISMSRSTQDTETVFIECGGQLGMFNIGDTMVVSVSGLHFVGCSDNKVSYVELFTVDSTIFQGVEGGGTALWLTEVEDVSIVRSEFLFNGQQQSYHEQNDSEVVGGALNIVLSSNVSIDSSNFTYNEAEIAGVIFIQNSSLSITQSNFSYNKANDSGGVIVSSDSSVIIDKSHFSTNSADYGGVVQTRNDSVYTINNSTFTNNSAYHFGGVINAPYYSSFTITRSSFSDNIVSFHGGVIAVALRASIDIITESMFNDSEVVGGALNIVLSSNVSIDSSDFTYNKAEIAGVIFIQNSSLSITQSNFSYNKANDSGGVIVSSDSSVIIDKSHFSTNSADYGGVMQTSNDSVYTVNNSTFTNNSAYHFGGVINAPYHSSFTITRSSFSDNIVSIHGGVIAVALRASIDINESMFSNNSAYNGGVIDVTSSPPNYSSHSLINITNSTFTYNHATTRGGVIFVDYESSKSSSFNIVNNTFTNNNASFGGVLDTYGGNYTLTGNIIANNTGGVLCNYLGSFNFTDSMFIANTGQNYQGILFVFECSIEITNCTFDSNFGSLYPFGSNLTIRGNTKFENGVEQASTPTAGPLSNIRNEGGAITSYQSTVIFTENCNFLNNQAMDGGAILATESTIVIYGKMTMAYNTAMESNGGGISLRQSDLEIKGTCNVSSNSAMRGGGIHAISSSISVHQPGILQFIDNSAVNGSGMYLEVNSKLYILRKRPRPSIKEDLLIFEGNHASHAGGAVYVADDTSAGSCLPSVECFVQTLALYPVESKYMKNISIHFSDNMATEQGSTLFGGLLDRCIPSPFTETYQVNNKKSNKYNSSVTYLQNISNIESDSISSLPVRVCFCTNKGEPDCSYQPPIKVKKGEAFTVSLVAVNQVGHSVAANVISFLSSSYGRFGEGQQTQAVNSNCTNLTYNVFSPQDEILKLYADGPCGSSLLSVRELKVTFTDCTCPIGFMPSDKPSDKSQTKCECVCNEALSPYVTNCNSTNFFLRKNSNSWITYSNVDGYVTHPNCPIDYCKPDVIINLNLPNGADSQCDNNRRGVLCGACQENFSLSLGSSHCISCRKNWPLELVSVILAAIIAGILLVLVLLVLNMTVAVGLINGFIFYANVVSANSVIFFPSSEPDFHTVFVAWLNLDIGFDTCFLNGLDAYIKTWLQFAFPVYVIVLVILVIIASEYFPKFATLIGKRDPVATLATLILLSYAKLLSTSITGLLFATLHYPDGERIVWLPDGNVNYFTEGKHAVLAIVSLLILIVIGIPYTLLILLWQWLVRAPRWKALECIRNTKFDAFISTYHEPCNVKYRYWPGLLLLVRVILYITASVTVSDNPQALLLITILLVGGLFLFKSVIGVRVHRKSYVDILETVMLFNLLVLAAFSSYCFPMDMIKQTAATYVSTIITFILLCGVIGYHVFILIKKSKIFKKKEANEYPLAAVQPEITHSCLILPSPPSESGSDDHKAEERNTIITETFADEL